MERAERIISGLVSPSPYAKVDQPLDEEAGALVEQIVTAGKNIALVRRFCVERLHAVYVAAARVVANARRMEQIARLDAAHDRAEATELYRLLRSAFSELDKIRFGELPEPETIVAIGDEMTKYDRAERYGESDED